MKNLCKSEKAKEFENELNGMCITYLQFQNLRKMWHSLSSDEQQEVDKCIRPVEEHLAGLDILVEEW